MVFDDTTQELLADLTIDGESCTIATGGHGGRGNTRFATSTNRAPTEFETGTPGEERLLRLELKLLADVGLRGFSQRRKIDTHRRDLGRKAEDRRLSLHHADAQSGRSFAGEKPKVLPSQTYPGSIEGAHEGKGLGFQFLRHIERTSFLLHVVDVSEWATEEPVKSFEIMRQELAAYDEPFTTRPFAVVATKIDVVGEGSRLRELRKYCQRHRYTCLPISAATREGLTTRQLCGATGCATPGNPMRDELLKQATRIVIKIGSSLIASARTGLRPEQIDRLADEITALRSGGREVLIVSSGAIVSGIKKLGLKEYPKEPPRKTGGRGGRPKPTHVGIRKIV